MLTIPAAAEPLLPFVKTDGLTLRQLAVLHVVQANPGQSVAPIAETLSIQKPAVTRAIDALEAQGLVRRARSPSDRREIAVSITIEGRDLLNRDSTDA